MASISEANSSLHSGGSGENQEGEAECRVCRGPEEPDNPLFSPCRCSGSIMFCHQECLLQWLQHSKKERCELCNHKFDFNPVYAENTPEKLSMIVVISQIARRAATEWVPFVLRIGMAFTLWLVFVPLVTSWLYRIWIHRSRGFVDTLSFACIWSDCVSGLIIAAAIILSFLSLMSFADFLRFHWDVPDANMGFERNIRGAADPVVNDEVNDEVNDVVNNDGQAAQEVEGNRQGGGDENNQQPVDDQDDDDDDDDDINIQQAAMLHEEHLEEMANQEEEAQEEEGFGLENDIELHVAVDEILGIRGPIHVLLRNLLWLLAFNCAYLGLFAFIPLNIGTRVMRLFTKLDMMLFREDSNLMMVLTEISKTASKEDHTLQLPDLATIGLGYLVLSITVFTLRSLMRALSHQYRSSDMLGRIRLGLDCTAAVVKVGILLFLKMFLLPLLLGVCLDVATLTMFEAEAPDRILFTAQNLVGSLLLHWVLGITFMLFVTVSVLQLREVLHPDIFAATIRPQEPHPDLLGSLLQESGATHTRRMIMSLAIYLVLLFALIWLPTWMCKEFIPQSLPIHLNMFYMVPQLQVPIELVVFHLSVLAFLEKFKNKMGELQHSFLLVACRKLGLTEYLLPLPNDGGPPLVRPPPGWDDLAGGTQERWAWGTEEPSDLERSLAPRQHPTLVFFRLAALFFWCWVTVLLLVYSGMIFPLVFGRSLFSLVHVAPRFRHDPIAFAVGLILTIIAKSIIKTGWDQLPEFGPWFQRLCRSPPSPKQCMTLFLFGVIWCGLIPLLLGVVFEVTFGTSAASWDEFNVSILSLFQDWSLGMFLLHLWALLLVLGMFAEGPGEARAAVFLQGRPVAPLARHRDFPPNAPHDMKLKLENGVAALWDGIGSDWSGVEASLFIKDIALHVLWFIIKHISLPIIGVFVVRWTNPASTLSFNSFRTGLAALGVVGVIMQFGIPITDWFKSMHDSIRDEQYLVGRELQDFQRTGEQTAANVD